MEQDAPLLMVERKNNDEVGFELPGKKSKNDVDRSAPGNTGVKNARCGAANGSTGDNAARKTLLKTVESQRYEIVKERVTALALMNCGENPLLLAIKVTEKLRERASKHEPDKADFSALADQVEEFTLRFLDPLKYESLRIRRFFSVNPELDVILDTAIKLQQRKFFDHPIVESIMNERWYTPMGLRWKITRPGLWLFLNIWCLFDVVLFPLSFILAWFLDWILSHVKLFFSARMHLMRLVSGEAEGLTQIYRRYFTIPYFISVRDTVSYMTLLAWHFAICVRPTEETPSSLEYVIFIYLIGRLLVEFKECKGMLTSEDRKMKLRRLKNYLRDYWNFFDLAILIIYFCVILPLRIATWGMTLNEPGHDNRALDVAAHFYGFNTMLLTIRAFGSLLESFEGVGTVQIALFNVVRDAGVIVVHLFLITLAFSTVLTKVFVNDKQKKKTWMVIFKQLIFALVELSDGFDFFKSSDSYSNIIIELLFVAYVTVNLIVVVNMLIALLSNTYQRVQDNSRKEWAFQKAVVIQTYTNHHPIPVPFNTVSLFLTMFPCCRMKKLVDMPVNETYWKKRLDDTVNGLQAKYRLTYGDSFPPTEPLDQMVEEVNDTESMVNQILHKTFTGQHSAFLPTGPKAWDAHQSICIDGCLITCKSYNPLYADQGYFSCYGARYNERYSHRFPHFEVMLLEGADKGRVSIGIVDSSHNHGLAPGLSGSVGFNTDLKMFDIERQTSSGGKQVTGIARFRRGDIIRCSVMFDQEKDIDGFAHIPVVFSVNGTRLIPEGGETLITHNQEKPWYPYIGFDRQNSALARMTAREDVDYRNLHMQEVKFELTETKLEITEAKTELSETKSEIQETKAELMEVKSELSEVKSEVNAVKSQLREATRSLNEKLDALLTKVSEKEY